MKLLLLSDIPPCSDLTAGLVLAKLCRFIPEGSLACFVVLNPHLTPQSFSDLDWIPTRTVCKPNEMGVYRRNGIRVGTAGAFGIETYKRLRLTPGLVSAACEFAREQRIDAIWAVLQGQTIIRMAVPLADKLNVPLYTQVWDPPSWWFKAHKVDPINARRATRDFGQALRRSRACAAASWAMAEHYTRTYGTPSTPLIASHDAGMALHPPPHLRTEHELVIGMAGQFYASEEWEQLVYALGQANWRVGSRVVRLKVLGRDAPSGAIPPENVEYLGWKGQHETVKVLSEECDLLYCPYPYTPGMEEVSRLSFPSKLSTYFAAGRPVLFHGPDYSSPSVYLSRHQAGYVCNDLYAAAIYNAIQTLVERPDLYADLAANGQAAFVRDFTSERMRESFFEFLGETGAALARGPESAPQPAMSGLPRTVFSGTRRAVYRAIIPRRIEKRIVLASPECHDLAVQHDRLSQQLDQIAAERDDLARRLATLGSERADLDQKLDTLVCERDGLVHSLRQQLGHIAAKRDDLARRLTTLSSERAELDQKLDALVCERDGLRSECAELRGQANALRVANDNQNALITGKLSLLDYRIQSLLRPVGTSQGGTSEGRALYLDLLEKALVGLLTDDPPASPWSGGKFDPAVRAIGRDWPAHAQTMIGTVRMRNLRHLLERLIDEGVPGDVIETGVWRGGACIYMRGILAAHGITDRRVWVADSFQGLPPPDDAAYPADHNDQHHTVDQLAASLAEVKQNFERYGLLDDQVRFLEGWFKDTLPTAPIERLALLRLDGDMYESTIQALDALYSKLSVGGYVIVDDFILEPCRQAVEDFRAKYGISAAMEPVDGAAVFWRKEALAELDIESNKRNKALQS